jgi:hypothetical protein
MMKDRQLERLATAIATSIVELVERTDGPVTLARVQREVPGFAKTTAPAWSHVVEHAGGETLIWDGMTEAGHAALRKVMYGRRVAIQFVNSLLYRLDGIFIASENWQPIVLLPASAANLETPNWLVRASPGHREHSLRRAAAQGNKGYRLLSSAYVGSTADVVSP